MTTTQLADPDRLTALAPLWRVILWNDDRSPADGVVDTLIAVFRKNWAEAFEITMTAHETGCALVEVVPRELAELHVDQVRSLARGRGWPLTCTCEKA